TEQVTEQVTAGMVGAAEADLARVGRWQWMRVRMWVLLGLRVSGGEEDELLGVALHLRGGYDEAKVVEEEKLELELVEPGEGEAADL
ncbi:hypothetical protein H0H87_006115, partial [Tephrocybe sp. NHM501043]